MTSGHPPRATEDLDVFVPTEFLVNLADMKHLQAALDHIGFKPVAEAKYLHFAKPHGTDGRVKIDMLTGPIRPSERDKLQVKPPRVRPLGNLQLHAYLTEEAIGFDEAMLALPTSGIGSDGRPDTVTVHIPAAVHVPAYETARVCGIGRQTPTPTTADTTPWTCTELLPCSPRGEFGQVREQVGTHRESAPVIRAQEIIRTHFSSPDLTGSLRLREHRLFTERMDVERFLGMLSELFE